MTKYLLLGTVLISVLFWSRQDLVALQELGEEDEVENLCFSDVSTDCAALGVGVIAACPQGACDLRHIQVGPIIIAIAFCPPGSAWEVEIEEGEIELSIEYAQFHSYDDFYGNEEREPNGTIEGCGMKARCGCSRPMGQNHWTCGPEEFKPIEWTKYRYIGNPCHRFWVVPEEQ
jgi:hypothetical protein